MGEIKSTFGCSQWSYIVKNFVETRMVSLMELHLEVKFSEVLFEFTSYANGFHFKKKKSVLARRDHLPILPTNVVRGSTNTIQCIH